MAPDNGLLTHVLADHRGARVHAITNAGLFRFHVSPTFHGRDVFGPVAGHLARGMPIEEVGPVVRGPAAPAAAADDAAPVATSEWEGEIVHVDRFGNLTTNVSDRDLSEILSRFGGDPTEVVVVVEGAVLPLVRTYGDVSARASPARWSAAAAASRSPSTAATRPASWGPARGASVRIRPALGAASATGRV